MGDVIVFFIINLCPIVYPLFKVYNRKDLNAFDFLILFISLYFNIIPIALDDSLNKYANELIIFSLFYFTFIYILLLVDIYWTEKYSNFRSIINMTKYLRQFKRISFNKWYYIILSIVIFIAITFYIPRATIAAKLEDTGVATTYVESSATMAFSSIFNFFAILVLLDFCFMIKNKSYSLIKFIPVIFFMILHIFFPRRDLLLFILEFLLIFYSLNRHLFNKNMIALIVGIGLFMYFVYFPFYNIMRNNRIPIDPKNPIGSLVELVENGIENYKHDDKNQQEAQNDRSLGLINAMCKAIKYVSYPEYGKVSLVGLKYAIPSIIVGKKRDATEQILEKKTHSFVDQADSVFLLAYVDFTVLGGIYALVLYFFISILYSYYANFFQTRLKSFLIPVFILFSQFSFFWNVEGKFESSISWFFGSIFLITLLIIMEKISIIKLYKKVN